MYMVSGLRSVVTDGELNDTEQRSGVRLPEAYRRFLTTYGEGTYRGVLNITRPDTGVLGEFAEYEFWEHDEKSPISREQIEQCVVVGTSIDGDFLAVSSEADGLLWLPRHSDRISLDQVHELELFQAFLNRKIAEVYESSPAEPAYFEPWHGQTQHAFFLLDKYRFTLPELAPLVKAQFGADLYISDEYSAQIFLQSLGGYLRLNYANGVEVAVFYEQGRETLFQQIADFLENHGCREHRQ
ncbi:SMI1/KNR4 family protein [Paenibacillus sp. y28]|uniref:SMI1/KNR4 family protein n=1 Tax=Paenibacillus sp. y28 TaxID=3129110 RepID=UPI00301A5AAD